MSERSRENSIPCGMLSLEPSFSVFPLKTEIHKMSPVDTSDRPVDTSCPYGQARCSNNWSCFFPKQNVTSIRLETFPLRHRNPPSDIMLPTGLLGGYTLPSYQVSRSQLLLTLLLAISGWTEVISLNSFPGGTSISPNGDHHRTAQVLWSFWTPSSPVTNPKFFKGKKTCPQAPSQGSCKSIVPTSSQTNLLPPPP